MPNIFDMINAKALAAYWVETTDTRVPYLGEALFPAKKKAGLDLAFIKGHKDRAVALKPSEFDAQATLRDRIGVKRIETEMPFFREGMTIKEKDRQELLRFRDNDAELYGALIGQIFDDRMQLIEGARIQPERMRMGLLAYGRFSIVANNVQMDYDYDVDGTWATNNFVQLTGTSMWSDLENSTPIEDIMEMQDKIEEVSGSRPRYLLMSRKTYNYLMGNKSIRLDLDPIGGNNRIMTSTLLDNYLQSKLEISIIVYNKRFRDENKATKQFYPDDRVTFLPEGPVGNTWFGTTPEEADLLATDFNGDVQIVETGVAVTVYSQTHTVNKNTIVSEIVLPSFERMEEVGVMEVA